MKTTDTRTTQKLHRLTQPPFAALLCWLVPLAAFADWDAPERIIWNKTPIPLRLTVGQEQLIHFPASVQVGVPEPLRERLRVQSVDGTVYLLAGGEFDDARVMAREVDTGRIYLFDVMAEAVEGPNHDLQIVAPAGDQRGPSAIVGEGEDAVDLVFPDYGYVALTRFASHQLYAPTRLLRELPGLVRVPVIDEPVPLVRGGAIEAAPLIAWRAGNQYLTAVRLTNQTDQPRDLDPRTLRGEWLTAAFQHGRLFPAGDKADTTAVYLISVHPFESSL